MSFLSGLSSVAGGGRYAGLGYARNPFPVRGQVWPDVYVTRPELEGVQDSLIAFLKGDGAGRLWAVTGNAGLGKSNFLQHVELEIKGLVTTEALSAVAYRYIASQQVSPRFLAQEIVQAIGEDAFLSLLKRMTQPPTLAIGTDLGRFLEAAVKRAPTHAAEDAQFACRWLGGHQTYAQERKQYNIYAKTRLAPAVGVAYLRVILDALAAEGIVKRLVLLLDEFEDVQTLRRDLQSEYLMALKGLVNAFNWDRLFVILAGQEAAFSTLGERIPSLQTRWEMVRLNAIASTDDAIRFATPYKDLARQRYIGETVNGNRAQSLLPGNAEIKGVFADMLTKRGYRKANVTPRDFLHSLHEWIENLIAAGDE